MEQLTAAVILRSQETADIVQVQASAAVRQYLFCRVPCHGVFSDIVTRHLKEKEPSPDDLSHGRFHGKEGEFQLWYAAAGVNDRSAASAEDHISLELFSEGPLAELELVEQYLEYLLKVLIRVLCSYLAECGCCPICVVMAVVHLRVEMLLSL